MGIFYCKILQNQKDKSILKNSEHILNRYLANYDGYSEIFIINPQTGIIEISTNHNSVGVDKSHDTYFTEPMRTKEFFIKDIYPYL